MTTDDDEFDARVEAELSAVLQAEKVKRRAEIVDRLRREESRAHYDKINARHPIESAGDPKFEAERRRVMAERARADNEQMDRANARPVEGSVMSRRRADAAGGGSGFKIR
jgi:hypothetical protein